MGELMTPAEMASAKALKTMFSCIDNHQCFRLEAGAGAGKTYSLIEALKHIIRSHAQNLSRKNQRIACITYTNVAKNEINTRTDNNPLIYAETIHAFSWSLIKGFQKQMLDFIPTISEKWKERISCIGGINEQQVIYDLGYPSVTDSILTLHHDDVLKITSYFLGINKFRSVLHAKFPIILIDEYQDTNEELAESIVKNLIDAKSNILIGFFGDHCQKIYGSKACC